jgi:hypothetical protein
MTLKWAELIRPMATTHSDDSSGRLVDLPIVCRDACSITVEVPDTPTLAPPGWYMLFVVDDCDIPSASLWVHLDRAATPPKPPAKGHGMAGMHGGHEHRPSFDIPGLPKRRATRRSTRKASKAAPKKSAP